ncbi:flagellar basal body L-ring protein FlgH [Rubrivivax gelatinosus]|uniref:Flagellar L-ring protein n=1 Tax=Rubrivivax gelatinosus TaxID=28068 RepID=A0A4R2MAM8_RUBGE|nr:flagellar basal body L-ring protein FlgH [Rubrivivax gelatinosus]MBK1689111.1 flagellar basal body L-ring protein [Rubrivivax gelatinosus]TCP03530.1 flagellar L-ring protein precursor FlgH [Rubrivivax gelatinosus]
MRAAAAVVFAAALAGCAAISPPQAPLVPAGDPMPAPVRARGQAGGLFVADAAWTLHSDTRAFRVGDVLTVALDETTQASKKSDTQFAKDSSVSLSPLVIGGKAQKTGVDLDAQRSFQGGATSTQQNALSGSITVVVHEVLPNGLLRVSGEKSLYLNQGEEFVRLAGYVRAGDIDADNRVSSQRVANARIVYSGRGTLADAGSAGWLTRFFNSPWMPF